MSDPDRAREPSMEEILASIRRIISDDRDDPAAEAGDEAASPRAGEVPGRLERAEPPAMTARDAPGDAAGETPGDAPAFGGAGAEDAVREPAADVADFGGERGPDNAETPSGAFAESGARFEPVAETDRGQADEEHLDAAFQAQLRPEPESEPKPDPEPAGEVASAVPVPDETPAPDMPAADGEPEPDEMHAAEDAQAPDTAPSDMQAGDAHAAADAGGEHDGMGEPAEMGEDGRLLSSRSDASVASAFASLENFVLSTHSRTLEDLVSEMLRPLLKDWLDANLPPLVERLVREEIERVTRGRR